MTLRPVYPRWRGEHSTNVSNPAHVGGLSPLARGTPWRSKFWWRNNRFIPAGAGNTTSWKLSICQTSVYPRWRGEHPGMAHRFRVPGGLSPLARGTRFPFLSGNIVLRFIPAGAGNTCAPSYAIFPIAVYPRWRGEHSIATVTRCGVLGLSPLTRGTRFCSHWQLRSSRFIPAGAGNTPHYSRRPDGGTVYPR